MKPLRPGPGRKREGHLVGLEKAWRRIRSRAELEDVRLHDLRHSFASVAAGMGESLLLIGSLLGHADAATTSRYAHLSDDPRRAAAERISRHLAVVMAGRQPPPDAEIIQIERSAVGT